MWIALAPSSGTRSDFEAFGAVINNDADPESIRLFGATMPSDNKEAPMLRT